MNNYDEVLRSLLDKHAPVKEQVVTVRPSVPWYTAEVTTEKRKRRQLERKERASELPFDRVQYVHQYSIVNNLIKSLKSQYYSSTIKENSGNQKLDHSPFPGNYPSFIPFQFHSFSIPFVLRWHMI